MVLIVGDYTARVGDPSGRDSTRPVLDDEQIEANADTYKDQAFKVLDPDAPRCATTASGSRCRARSSSTSSAASRSRGCSSATTSSSACATSSDLGLELLYPLLQGYDSVAIEADVELGATDQLFNLLFGRDVQGAYGQAPQSILTMPILVGLDGTRKMSQELRQLRRGHR